MHEKRLGHLTQYLRLDSITMINYHLNYHRNKRSTEYTVIFNKKDTKTMSEIRLEITIKKTKSHGIGSKTKSHGIGSKCEFRTL